MEKENFEQKKNDIGLDQDEQEMNGLYGMAETQEEDDAHNTDQ